jgi:chromosome segregation ATPase
LLKRLLLCIIHPGMKNRIGIILLALICIGLGIVLIATRKKAEKRQAEDEARVEALSNKWVKTSNDLDEQRQVSAMLEKDVEKQKQVFADLTNSFSRVSGQLTLVSGTLEKTEATLKSTEEEVKKRDSRISELENQNQVLDKQALDLSAAMTNLTMQIADTQRKLSASEGDKAFLEKELKRLMAEKSELERQFNDLAVLRAQVSRLKEELSIARRIEWIRRGLFASTDQKGAQKLITGLKEPTAATKPAENYDLNVEVSSDGKVRVIPPGTNSPPTNAPASK